MKRLISIWISILLLQLFAGGQTIVSVTIDGSINPVTADFIRQSINKADKLDAECLVINLNTPGGLLKSTRTIVSNILESPIPVIVYVSPGGSHAGSAGVFITMAAHVAAMAPGTNIGAAHPVDMQGQVDTLMSEKVTNDAAAFIKSIAQKRNRNMEWAERAVRRSFSYTESEALEYNVIDMIARNEKELLARLHNKTYETNEGQKSIKTIGAGIEKMEMSWIQKLLNVISDPNIAYILFMIGVYGIMFELFSPGAIFPGVAGGICLILGFYSLNTLPINYAGLALIVFGIILFVLEVKIISHGLLSIGGILALLLGSMMLIQSDSDLDLVRISRSVIISTVLLTALFFFFVIGMGLKAQRGKPVTGASAMIGEIGESLEDLNPVGYVRVHGEIWNAETLAGLIAKGSKIKVNEVKGLKLIVEPV